MSEMICGTCKWHKYDRESHDWLCTNEECDLAGCWTSYNYSPCDEWEGHDE